MAIKRPHCDSNRQVRLCFTQIDDVVEKTSASELSIVLRSAVVETIRGESREGNLRVATMLRVPLDFRLL